MLIQSARLHHLEEYMKFLYAVALLLILAGCGSGGGNFAAVTPVMADTRGTYRLSSATVTTTTPAPASAFSTVSYTSGTLRLSETNYSKTGNGGEADSSGGYRLGQSVNTILNSREGSFTLTPNAGQPPLTGSYHVDPDVTLTLNYSEVALADGTVVSRSETWIKESDSPHFGE
jgi:hypothetical protein